MPLASHLGNKTTHIPDIISSLLRPTLSKRWLKPVQHVAQGSSCARVCLRGQRGVIVCTGVFESGDRTPGLSYYKDESFLRPLHAVHKDSM